MLLQLDEDLDMADPIKNTLAQLIVHEEKRSPTCSRVEARYIQLLEILNNPSREHVVTNDPIELLTEAQGYGIVSLARFANIKVKFESSSDLLIMELPALIKNPGRVAVRLIGARNSLIYFKGNIIVCALKSDIDGDANESDIYIPRRYLDPNTGGQKILNDPIIVSLFNIES